MFQTNEEIDAGSCEPRTGRRTRDLSSRTWRVDDATTTLRVLETKAVVTTGAHAEVGVRNTTLAIVHAGPCPSGLPRKVSETAVWGQIFWFYKWKIYSPHPIVLPLPPLRLLPGFTQHLILESPNLFPVICVKPGHLAQGVCEHRTRALQQGFG